ncbi:hypothetical protein ACHHYP_05925, partial [Achlya hypogyna]
MAVLAFSESSKWRALAQRASRVAVSGGGLVVIALLAADAIVNNWAINDFLGDGLFFTTPVVAIETLDQLPSQYAFQRGSGVEDLSNTGTWLANYTVVQLVTKSDKVYIVSGGTFPLTPATNLCPVFKGEYPADLAASTSLRLALAADTITFYRGNAISHAFSTDMTTNLGNTSMTSAQLMSLGYAAGRSAVDLRFTHKLTLKNTSDAQSLLVPYFRIFPRNFCTGCNPVAELGHSVCNMTLSYDDAAKKITVTTSAFVPGSSFELGLMMTNSAFGVVAL